MNATPEHTARLQRALELKAEAYDGKRSPASCIEQLAVEYAQLPSTEIDALWSEAWDMRVAPLVAPFPWFGGKSQVADVLWRAFGDVSTYVEAFAGSLAALLNRPTPPRVETVNDLDGFICNFWRAVAHAPDEVAAHADWPVNEADLHARHAWLVQQRAELTERLMGDPDFYDAKVAGWWVWGVSCWIGSEWCSGKGPWVVVDGRLVRVDAQDGEGIQRGDKGVHAGVIRQRPKVDGARSKGVHQGDAGIRRKIPNKAKGVNAITRTRPHLAHEGMGVHSAGVRRAIPHITAYAAGNGVHQAFDVDNGRGAAGRFEDLCAWMRALADRLRRVRVVCGDWTRVTSPSVVLGTGFSGVLLDPPYQGVGDELYAQRGEGIAEAVHRWAIEHGSNPKLRIAVCGYAGDFDWPSDWREYAWKARGGYGTQENAARERIWFSPACLDFDRQLGLFAANERGAR